MKIRYQNGIAIEGTILARTGQKMRIALKGDDDPMELTNINGTWISEDCEPVALESGTSGRPVVEYSDDSFICPPDLADHLNCLLFAGDSESLMEERSMARISQTEISGLLA